MHSQLSTRLGNSVTNSDRPNRKMTYNNNQKMSRLLLIILIQFICLTTPQNIDDQPPENTNSIFDSNNLTCIKLNQTYHYRHTIEPDDNVPPGDGGNAAGTLGGFTDATSLEQGDREPGNLFNFDGHITVLFRIVPMPLYEDEVLLFQNLYDRFTNNGYKNINFTIITTADIIDAIRNLVEDIAVIEDTSENGSANSNRTLFDMKPLQVYVIDNCGRIAYIIEPPWSFIEFPYVKAAVLSTIYDMPCDYCDKTFPFLDSKSSLLPQSAEIETLTTAPGMNDTESSIELISNNQSDFKSNFNPEDDMAELVNEYLRDKQYNNENNVIDFQDDLNSGDDEIINLLTPLPNHMNSNHNDTYLDNANFVMPIKLTIPMEHVHYYPSNDTFVKYKYVVLKTDDESYHQHLTTDYGEILYELTMNASDNITVNKNGSVTNVENIIDINDLRKKLLDKAITLNNTQIYVNEKNGEIYEKLKHYQLNDNTFDELSLIEIDIQKYRTQHQKHHANKSNRDNYSTENSASQSDNDHSNSSRFRSQKDIAKHYDQLLQWLTWQFN